MGRELFIYPLGLMSLRWIWQILGTLDPSGRDAFGFDTTSLTVLDGNTLEVLQRSSQDQGVALTADIRAQGFEPIYKSFKLLKKLFPGYKLVSLKKKNCVMKSDGQG